MAVPPVPKIAALMVGVDDGRWSGREREHKLCLSIILIGIRMCYEFKIRLGTCLKIGSHPTLSWKSHHKLLRIAYPAINSLAID